MWLLKDFERLLQALKKWNLECFRLIYKALKTHFIKSPSRPYEENLLNKFWILIQLGYLEGDATKISRINVRLLKRDKYGESHPYRESLRSHEKNSRQYWLSGIQFVYVNSLVSRSYLWTSLTYTKGLQKWLNAKCIYLTKHLVRLSNFHYEILWILGSSG